MSTNKPRPQTFSRGAADERAALIAKLRRELYMARQRPGAPFSTVVTLEALLQWAMDRRTRYEARLGGLGRKKKDAK